MMGLKKQRPYLKFGASLCISHQWKMENHKKEMGSEGITCKSDWTLMLVVTGTVSVQWAVGVTNQLFCVPFCKVRRKWTNSGDISLVSWGWYLLAQHIHLEHQAHQAQPVTELYPVGALPSHRPRDPWKLLKSTDIFWNLRPLNNKWWTLNGKYWRHIKHIHL